MRCYSVGLLDRDGLEIDGKGYSRQLISSDWSKEIRFYPAGQDWGPVSYLAIYRDGVLVKQEQLPFREPILILRGEGLTLTGVFLRDRMPAEPAFSWSGGYVD